jgi:hypothetical protein
MGIAAFPAHQGIPVTKLMVWMGTLPVVAVKR